jgi:hypothetical protein
VVVTDENGIDTVERRLAGEDRLADVVRNQLVLPETVIEQRVEQNAGVTLRHHDTFVSEIPERCLGQCAWRHHQREQEKSFHIAILSEYLREA